MRRKERGTNSSRDRLILMALARSTDLYATVFCFPWKARSTGRETVSCLIPNQPSQTTKLTDVPSWVKCIPTEHLIPSIRPGPLESRPVVTNHQGLLVLGTTQLLPGVKCHLRRHCPRDEIVTDMCERTVAMRDSRSAAITREIIELFEFIIGGLISCDLCRA